MGTNSSLKPALRGFFSFMGTLGAAAAAAAARVGNPDCDVGCLAAAVDTVTVADADAGSFVVDDVSLHLIRGCLRSSSGLDDTLVESPLSESNPFFLAASDDIIYKSI